MKKVITIFDLHVGNFPFLANRLRSLKERINKQNDIVYLFTTKQTSKIYQTQQYKNILSDIKILQCDQKLNFGQNLKKILQLNPQYQSFIFKTTLPIVYYPQIFKFDDLKDFTDNWYIFNGHDVAICPDRTGKIGKIGQQFYSIKTEQHTQKIQRDITQYQPDYFMFGRQFLNILFMINDFKTNNFIQVIRAAAQLKKPVNVGQRAVIKKFWNNIPGHVKYSLIPELVLPIVQSNDNGKIKILKLPVVVGNQYFKNSAWLSSFLGQIQKIQIGNISGKDILNKIAIKFDGGSNSAIYLRKFMNQILKINNKTKFYFYTSNNRIKELYKNLLTDNINNSIQWVDVQFVNTNVFQNELPDILLKFDFNFYDMGYGEDLDAKLSNILSMPNSFDSKDWRQIRIQNFNNQKQTVIMGLFPLSAALFNKERYLNKLVQQNKYKKAIIYLQPRNIQAVTNDPNKFSTIINGQLENCKKQLRKLQGFQIQLKLLTPSTQIQYNNILIDERKKHNVFYLSNKNPLYTIRSCMNKEIIIA